MGYDNMQMTNISINVTQLKEFADDNFKFDENGRKLSIWVENTVFSKGLFPGVSKGVIVWESIKQRLQEKEKMLDACISVFTLFHVTFVKSSICWLIQIQVICSPQFNPFPHNDSFWCPWETSLLKTLHEKEKLLVMSNFSFSHGVFYLFGWLSLIFVKFEIMVRKLFQFGRV